MCIYLLLHIHLNSNYCEMFSLSFRYAIYNILPTLNKWIVIYRVGDILKYKTCYIT